ncbi:MAG: PAS domain-containing protein [Deltaproteobacteria bacterium]|nr:PAS domain-containing protein [Deltaproteobacteria bacterium]MBN2674351.1 PAS domain-containing protein [Deltaproteobacteria bacterium]
MKFHLPSKGFPSFAAQGPYPISDAANLSVSFVSLSPNCPDFFSPRPAPEALLQSEFNVIFCEEQQIETLVHGDRYQSLRGILVTLGNEVHIEPVTDTLWHFCFIPGILPSLESTLLAFASFLQNQLHTSEHALAVASNTESIISGAISRFPGAIYQFYANNDGSRGFSFFSEGVDHFLGGDIPMEQAFHVVMSRIHPDDFADVFRSIETAIQTRSMWQYEARFILPCGQTIWVEGISTPQETPQGILFNGLLRDTTEQHKMRETIIQTEKMMSIGGLAAGIAHEINNPLAGLQQSIQVLKQRLDVSRKSNRAAAEQWNLPTDAFSGYLDERHVFRLLHSMTDACHRMSTIVQDMLNFSRDDHHTFSPHDVSELLDQTVNIASTDYNLKKKYDFKQIQVNKNYDRTVPLLECIPSELQQVFMNILKNGAQAMYDAHAARGITSEFFLKTAYHRESDTVIVEIADNGPGIPDPIRNRIFEPFFTTKSPGAGTGLGLSVSYFIVSQTHHGAFKVCSKPTGGACFQIRLPRIQPNREDERCYG